MTEKFTKLKKIFLLYSSQ